MTRLILVALALALSSVPAGAQQPPPPHGTPRDFVLPQKETLQLDNGLAITFIDYGAVPKVTILAALRTGNIDEGRSTWLADVAAEMLKEGTTSRGASEIARAAASMGGGLAVSAGAEQTTVAISVLSEHAPEAARLLAEVLRHPRLPASELPRIIANFERSLSVAQAEPDAIAGAALAGLVYGDHPFGRAWPQPGQLAGYSIEDVRGFYAGNFGARRTHVYVAGRFDRGALEQALRTAFGDWPAGPQPSELPPTAANELQLRFIARPGAPQSSLRLALPAPGPADAEWFPFSVMNSLLGGTFMSRITSNIREDKGYTYSPRSVIGVRRGSALWTQQADVTTEHTAAALVEIYHEIERLRREPPPDDELDRIKNYSAGLFVIRNSSPDGVLGQLAFMDLHGLPADYLSQWVANVYRVTAGQVSAAARRWIEPRRMTVVVVGDLPKVEASVGALPELASAPSR